MLEQRRKENEEARAAGTSPETLPAQKGKRSTRKPRVRARGRKLKEPTPEQIARRAKWAEMQAKAEKVATTFKLLCKSSGLPMPVRELQFAPPRKWRFDYAWEPERIALEVEGGVWSGGRHTRGSGYLLDMEKYNEAALRGWTLLRATPATLCTSDTIELILRALTQRSAA